MSVSSSRALGLLFAASAAALGNMYLLMSSVPLHVAERGGGGAGAGLTTGTMMLATVAAEPLVPRLTARLGARTTMAAGLLLLGVPALLLAATSWLPPVLALCALRGVGLGVVVVAGTALVAGLVPAERRSRTLGVYGVVISVPAIAGLPLGVRLTEHVGFAPVAITAGVLALAGLLATAGLPAARTPDADHGAGLLAGLRSGALARPALVFAATTIASGVVATFLPLAVDRDARGLAAAALFVQSCVTPVARWAAGRAARGARLLVPAVVLAAAGIAGLAAGQAAAVVAGAALFGAGFGIAQNVTLAVMFDRVPEREFGTVSALWNLAYDAGIGIGATCFGVLAEAVSYQAAFAATACLVAAALVPAALDRRTVSTI